MVTVTVCGSLSPATLLASQRERVGARGARVRGVGDHAGLVERAERALRRGGVGSRSAGRSAGSQQASSRSTLSPGRTLTAIGPWKQVGGSGEVDVDLDLAGRGAAVAVGHRERDVVLAEPVAVGGVDDTVIARRARAVPGGGAGRVGEVVVVGVDAVGEQELRAVLVDDLRAVVGADRREVDRRAGADRLGDGRAVAAGAGGTGGERVGAGGAGVGGVGALRVDARAGRRRACPWPAA